MKDWVYKVIFTILAVAIFWLIVDMLGFTKEIKQGVQFGFGKFDIEASI